MAFVVETGTGIAGATAYADVLFADEYFAGHPFYSEQWFDFTEERKKHLLGAASQFLDMMFNWKGVQLWEGQGLRFPRRQLYNPDGFLVPCNRIPVQLKQATCEQARYLGTPEGNPDAPNDTAGIEELEIDVIRLKFTSSGVHRPAPVAVARLLRGLGAPYSSSRVRKVQVSL